ncbi:MAG: tetratricopeptide repeat protein [Thermoguttaceae bacterium]
MEARYQEFRQSDTRERENGEAGDAAQLTRDGWQLWGDGRMKEAAAKFQRAVRLDPKSENAWNGLGWASFNSGKMPGAETAFQKVIALNPNHPAALNGLGQLYLAQRKYAAAEPFLLKAAPQAPAAWWGLTKLYLLQGKFGEAEKWAQKIVDTEPGDGDARRMLQAAKEKHLSDGLRLLIEPPPPVEPKRKAEGGSGRGGNRERTQINADKHGQNRIQATAFICGSLATRPGLTGAIPAPLMNAADFSMDALQETFLRLARSRARLAKVGDLNSFQGTPR